MLRPSIGPSTGKSTTPPVNVPAPLPKTPEERKRLIEYIETKLLETKQTLPYAPSEELKQKMLGTIAQMEKRLTELKNCRL